MRQWRDVIVSLWASQSDFAHLYNNLAVNRRVRVCWGFAQKVA